MAVAVAETVQFQPGGFRERLPAALQQVEKAAARSAPLRAQGRQATAHLDTGIDDPAGIRKAIQINLFDSCCQLLLFLAEVDIVCGRENGGNQNDGQQYRQRRPPGAP